MSLSPQEHLCFGELGTVAGFQVCSGCCVSETGDGGDGCAGTRGRCFAVACCVGGTLWGVEHSAKVGAYWPRPSQREQLGLELHVQFFRVFTEVLLGWVSVGEVGSSVCLCESLSSSDLRCSHRQPFDPPCERSGCRGGGTQFTSAFGGDWA